MTTTNKPNQFMWSNSILKNIDEFLFLHLGWEPITFGVSERLGTAGRGAVREGS